MYTALSGSGIPPPLVSIVNGIWYYSLFMVKGDIKDLITLPDPPISSLPRFKTPSISDRIPGSLIGFLLLLIKVENLLIFTFDKY